MADAVAAYLTDLTGSGLEMETSENDGAKSAPTFPTETITAYLPLGPAGTEKKAAAQKIEELRRFLAGLCLFFDDCPAPKLVTETIVEEDWGKKWKSFFTSFQVTPTLTIKPSWEAAEEQKDRGCANTVIEMDPGLAFGTGHHASTQLALLLLEELFQRQEAKPATVLDIGTGSGILAMACILFGAEEALALDNDPDAVETAKLNIARNHLEERVTVSGLEVAAVKAGFDLVVANITHDTLAALAQILTSRLNPGGSLVLSGILQGDQEHAICETYVEHGLELIKTLKKDEWAALQFHKK